MPLFLPKLIKYGPGLLKTAGLVEGRGSVRSAQPTSLLYCTLRCFAKELQHGSHRYTYTKTQCIYTLTSTLAQACATHRSLTFSAKRGINICCNTPMSTTTHTHIDIIILVKMLFLYGSNIYNTLKRKPPTNLLISVG